MTDFTQVIDALFQLGNSALFLWLLLREIRAHEQTRQQFEQTRQQYWDDLREMVGIRASLSQTRQTAPPSA